jgi:hypothetical protein
MDDSLLDPSRSIRGRAATKRSSNKSASEKYGVVITTVNYPTRAVKEISRDAGKLSAQFILIGDQKSPADFEQAGALYLDLDAQRKSGFKYAELAPPRHYARKNVGYLTLIRDGVTILLETDDDNIPHEEFWAPRTSHVSARVITAPDWVNVYMYYSSQLVWPRGLPLDQIKRPPPPLEGLPSEDVYCPIQQGLADENPDVDAIYRLVLPLPLTFRRREPIALRGAWCPFNSQNTTWFREAFPLLYLPYYCSFRMTDIWRSLVAQRIAYLNGWHVLFHSATVVQERNEHDLLRDFEEEVPGYLNNERIRNALEELTLPSGSEHVGTAMQLAYRRLAALNLVGDQELPLLDAWLADISHL